MKIRKACLGLGLTTMLSIATFTTASAAPPTLKWLLTHHGSHNFGSRYCFYLGCCCLPTFGPGAASAAELAAGYGNVGGEIINVGGGKQFHIIFYSQPTFAPDSSWLNVGSIWDLDPGVSHVLGYESVQLLPGIYPYSPGTSTYGDLYISATVGAAVPQLSSWGALAGALTLLILGGIFLSRRVKRPVTVSLG